jgi:hypothetical protein
VRIDPFDRRPVGIFAFSGVAAAVHRSKHTPVSRSGNPNPLRNRTRRLLLASKPPFALGWASPVLGWWQNTSPRSL